MDSPFQSWYEKPAQQRRSYAYHPSVVGVPVYPVDPTRGTRHSAYADRQPPSEKSNRRVVQIPVHFFGSDSDRRSESALRIQKVFRGFFVRKSVRKIKEIRSQVDEIEARLSRDEVVEMIRGNERERLRMSESLMNLLLKLDGIRGIDSGIRVCRKGVTSKAIALQEKIDAICAPDSVGNADCKVEIGSQELEDGVPAAADVEGSRSEENSKNSNDIEEMLGDWGEESKGSNSEKLEVERDSVLTEDLDVVVASELNPSDETRLEPETGTSKNIDFDEDNVDCVRDILDQCNGKDMISEAGKEDDANGNVEFLANSELGEILGDVREEHGGGKDVEVEKEILEVQRNNLDTEIGINSVIEATPETCPGQWTLKNLDLDHGNAETVKEMLAYSDDHGENLCDLTEELKGGDSLAVEDKTMEVDTEHLDERKCELLEQMMEENKKMMLMMTQLYERNEMQLQMLDALTNRVESLEKAYLCDKLRNRRKKMKKNKGAVTCVED